MISTEDYTAADARRLMRKYALLWRLHRGLMYLDYAVFARDKAKELTQSNK